jgi:hypothetical protein
MYLPLLESQRTAVIACVHDGKWILCTKEVVFVVMEAGRVSMTEKQPSAEAP